MNENTLEYDKLNLMNFSQKPAIELSSYLLADHQETAAKKDQKPIRSNTPKRHISKQIVDLSIPHALADKPKSTIDTENLTFPDLQAAYDLALAASSIAPPEPEIKENKKDKKKGATPDSDSNRKYISLNIQVTS